MLVTLLITPMIRPCPITTAIRSHDGAGTKTTQQTSSIETATSAKATSRIHRSSRAGNSHAQSSGNTAPSMYVELGRFATVALAPSLSRNAACTTPT